MPRERHKITTKLFFRRWYENLAQNTGNLNDWTFMNYGYASENQTQIILSEHDEWNRYPIQLYHHLFTEVKTESKDILDIGSGRGGGAAYISKTFSPRTMTGVELSHEAVKLSRKLHGESKQLKYVQGDAESLPMEDAQFDIVTSVEASHCFASMAKFLRQVSRVLKPGGDLLLTDFRSQPEFETLEQELKETVELSLVSTKNITPNVLLALELDHERKEKFRDEFLTDEIKDHFAYFAALKGSKTHEAFVTGNYLYKTFHLKRSE